MVLLLGTEREGIPAELIDVSSQTDSSQAHCLTVLQQLDVCVEIPQFGVLRSLNVHVSGALFLWEFTRQQIQQNKLLLS